MASGLGIATLRQQLSGQVTGTSSSSLEVAVETEPAQHAWERTSQ